MGWKKTYRQIKEELIGQTGKRALLVEGAEDESLFRIFLSRKFGSDWENTWVLTNAEGKKSVVSILAEETDWLGIVDRDEWDEEIIAEKQSELNNLFALPRFCLESYAIDPKELWQALPHQMRAKVDGGFEALENEILQNKEQWLRHGVLWSVINPLWSGLRALGFQQKLLDFETAQDDHTIKKTLREWHRYLDPDDLFKRFEQKLREVKQASPKDQIVKWIHGKQFFREKVHPVLNNFLGQIDTQKRLEDIFKTRDLPDDLEPLWSRIKP